MVTNTTERKLTAILSADVKGYSKLMGEDDESTVNTITSYREIITQLIQDHDGRVVDTPGDNILAQFGSALNAVNSAIEIQNALETENKKLHDNRRMDFRIGINLGDILHKDDRIYGDGVNVAARIESLADPGGICISRGVFDQVKQKVRQGFEYLGEHTVKNIPEPVRIYRILLSPEDEGKVIEGTTSKPAKFKRPFAVYAAVFLICIAAGIWIFYQQKPDIEPASKEAMEYPLPDKPSIAVLPFDNMSGDPQQEYFSDGISENIITSLSKTNQLFVIARNSTFTYKNRPVKVKQIAEELGVRYVLEGSVQKQSNRVRISAQLIDATSGHHLWAERYERDLKDLFALQDELTMKIVTTLQVKLTEGEQARIWSDKSKNLDLLLKRMEAMSLWNQGTNESLVRYSQVVKETIDMAPEVGWGYANLGWYHWRLAFRGVSPKDNISKAYKLAQKAIALDDSDSYSHSLVGIVYLMMRQHEKAIEEGERAVALNPNGAFDHGILGVTLSYSKREDDAIDYLKKGIRLDPFPASWYFAALGRCYRQKGQYEKALIEFKKALNISPEDIGNHLSMAIIYSLLGNQKEAGKAAESVLEIKPNFSVKTASKGWPYKDQADLNLVIDALLKAGLPEHPPLQLPDKPSIAVLAFDNLTGDPEQEYFSDGFTEHIITSLSKVPYLFVIARNSTFSFKNKNVEVQQIAEKLGVRYILEGSVQRFNDDLRIAVQLIDAITGRHIWAESYDRKIDDIFSLQDEIAMKIMAELQVNIAYESLGQSSPIQTKNLKAYEKFLKGFEIYFRRTEEDILQARKIFKEAIALDPEYGAAYVMLGHTHLDDIWYHRTKDRAKSLQTAEQLAQKAIELTGQDDFNLRLLSTISMLKKQYDKAIIEIQKAIEFNPNSAQSYFVNGMVLRFSGRNDEAIPILKKAIRLNPVAPITYLNMLAWAYFYTEQYEEAIPLWNKTVKLNPDYLFAYQGLIGAYQMSGDEIKARESVAEIMRIKPTYSMAMVNKLTIHNVELKKRILEAYRKAGIPE